MTPDQPAVSIRPLTRADLPAALALQSENYPPFLVESEVAFASRLDTAAPYCFAATVDGALAGYLLAHGWPAQSPPRLDSVLPGDVTGDVLFLHDLGVAQSRRGMGIGRKLIEQAFRKAVANGLGMAELVAVEGAAAYWRTLGFVEGDAPPALAAKLAAYGPDARWMRRPIGPVELSPKA